MANFLHVTNAKGRNATVGVTSVRPRPSSALGVPGLALTFRRYLASAESGTHAALTARFGADYADALMQDDPEVDLERVGQFLCRKRYRPWQCVARVGLRSI